MWKGTFEIFRRRGREKRHQVCLEREEVKFMQDRYLRMSTQLYLTFID